MSPGKLLTLLAFLLLLPMSSQAQSRPGAEVPKQDPKYQEVKVSVTLPKAVSIVRDCGKILLSRNNERDKLGRLIKRLKDKNEELVIEGTVDVPKNWVTRKLGLAE